MKNYNISKHIAVLLLSCSFNAHANNGIYIMLSNYMAQAGALEIITNNAANTNTFGYQADYPIMKEFDINSKQRKNAFVVLSSTYISPANSGFKYTGRPLDIAIDGPGYFKIMTNAGPRYTLNGNFVINVNRTLTTAQGHPVLSADDNTIEIPAGTIPEFSPSGIVSSNGAPIGQMGVFIFATKYSLTKEGNGLYKSTETPMSVDYPTIVSGAVALSNADSIHTMANLVEIQRSASITNNLMNDMHELEEDVVGTLLK